MRAGRAHPDGTATVRFAGGVLRRYLVAGPVPHLLDRYSELTGRPALPPRWALGYHQSRWGYRCEADVRAITDGFAKLGIPLSAVHLDIDYMRGYRVFTVDPDRFPDLGAPRPATRPATGVRVVTIVDAGVKIDPDYDVFREGRDQHRFCTDGHGQLAEGVVWPGRSVFPDFTDPGTRSWWAGKYRTLTDAGVAGIWHDMNEPTSISLLRRPDVARHHPPPLRRPRWRPRRGPQPLRVAHEPRRLRRAARGATGAPALHRVALGLGRDAALGVELDRRRRLDVGVDAPADRHRGRARACRGCRTRDPTSAASAASPTTSCTCGGCR